MDIQRASIGDLIMEGGRLISEAIRETRPGIVQKHTRDAGLFFRVAGTRLDAKLRLLEPLLSPFEPGTRAAGANGAGGAERANVQDSGACVGGSAPHDAVLRALGGAGVAVGNVPDPEGGDAPPSRARITASLNARRHQARKMPITALVGRYYKLNTQGASQRYGFMPEELRAKFLRAHEEVSRRGLSPRESEEIWDILEDILGKTAARPKRTRKKDSEEADTGSDSGEEADASSDGGEARKAREAAEEDRKAREAAEEDRKAREAAEEDRKAREAAEEARKAAAAEARKAAEEARKAAAAKAREAAAAAEAEYQKTVSDLAAADRELEAMLESKRKLQAAAAEREARLKKLRAEASLAGSKRADDDRDDSSDAKRQRSEH